MADQVYAVVHDSDGRFLIAHKPAMGYFFSTGDGVIVPDGQVLNGGNKYALPGGERKAGEDVASGAWREFHEETGVELTTRATKEQSFMNGGGDRYAAGYFEVSKEELGGLSAAIGKNLDEARKAVEELRLDAWHYSDFRRRWPTAPLDNELDNVAVWDVNDADCWDLIDGFQREKATDWFYDILSHLKTGILHS